MKRSEHRERAGTPTRAFTVLELVVVLALLVALMSGIAFVARGGGRAVALRTAQGTIASLLAVARSEAAQHGRNTALLVHLDPTVPGYVLRRLAVGREDALTGAWVATGSWQMLPSGIALLPPTVPSAESIEEGAVWSALRSSALAGASVVCDGLACAPVVFTPRGTVFRGAGDLVLAPVGAGPEGGAAPWRYEQPEAVRGLSLSVYGLVTFVEGPDGF